MRMWWNGRHDSFRSYWAKVRGVSTPLIRTIRFSVYKSTTYSWPAVKLRISRNYLSVVFVVLFISLAAMSMSNTGHVHAANDTLITNHGVAVKDNDLRGWVNAFVNWIAYRIGPGVVLLMILYAGIEYIASQGDPAKIKSAKERIEGSLLGLTLLLLIGVIMRFILPPTA